MPLCPRRRPRLVAAPLAALLLSLASLGFVAAPARAGDGALPPAVEPPPPLLVAWSACVPDIEAFCPAVVPGGGRIVRCLVRHWPALSPACRDGMAAARAALAP